MIIEWYVLGWLCLYSMFRIAKAKPDFRMGKKMGPKNVSPIEQMLWSKGYRMFQEKIDGKMRYRSYFRGGKCIRVGDRVHNSRNVPKMATI